MISSGNKPPGLFPPKLRNMAGDIQRNNHLFGIDVKFALNMFKVSRKSPFFQQIILASEKSGASEEETFKLIEKFTEALLVNDRFRDKDNNVLIGDKSIVQTDEVNSIISWVFEETNKTSEEKANLMKLAQSEEICSIIKANSLEFVERGVYGVPTFFISDAVNHPKEFMIFGSDRFEQIADICKKPYYGCRLQLLDTNSKI